jgi:hypothetical protein
MHDSTNSDSITDYASNSVAATLISSKNQIRRMYPTVLLDEHPDAILPIILDRTVHSMIHLDQKFDMNSIFDQDHFNKMKAEAFIHLAWLNTPDNTPYPESLKYSSTSVSSDEDDETVVVVPKVAPAAKVTTVADVAKNRIISKNSKFQKALLIYTEDQASHANRAATLRRMITELEMNPSTANVYYSKFKNPVSLQK